MAFRDPSGIERRPVGTLSGAQSTAAQSTAAPQVNPAATNEPVTAPAGTLRQELQQQRQGKTQYGAIAQGLKNPEVWSLMAMGLPTPPVANLVGRVGATIAQRLGYNFPATVPPVLYHRTPVANVPGILQQGLRPGSWLSPSSSQSLVGQVVNQGRIGGASLQFPTQGANLVPARTFPLARPAYRVVGQPLTGGAPVVPGTSAPPGQMYANPFGR